jgi:hypothetical protein
MERPSVTITLEAPARPAELERRRRAGHAFIDRGWPVLPLIPGQSRPMACELCSSKSPKRVMHVGVEDCPHPADYCHGWRAGTLDHQRLEAWCNRFPQMNLGIATDPARLLVIDLDTNSHGKIEDPAYQIEGVHDGLDVFALTLIRYRVAPARTQPWPDTLTVTTPSGGLHLYWRIPRGLRIRSLAGAFGPLVDVKSAGAFIVAPTSAKPTGEYRRTGPTTEPARAPDWLLHHLKVTGHMPEPAPRRSYQPRTQGPDEIGLRILDEAAQRLATAPEGTRHAQLCTATTAAAHLVADGRVTEDQALDAIRDAGYAAGRDGREIDDAWRTAIAKAGAR